METIMDFTRKLTHWRTAALYGATLGGASAYHRLWLFSKELGLKIPPFAEVLTWETSFSHFTSRNSVGRRADHCHQTRRYSRIYSLDRP